MEGTPAELPESNGGGTTTPPVVEPPPAPPASPTVAELQAQLVAQQAKSEEQARALGQLQEWYQQVAPQIERKPDGTFTLKSEEISEDEVKAQQMAAKTALQINQMAEASALSREKLATEMRSKDPFFERNMNRTAEIIATVPLANRGPDSWKKAYNMAKGEIDDQYEQFWRKSEAEKVKADLDKSRGAAAIVSSQAANDESDLKEAVKNFRWTPAMQRAADMQVRAGMVTSRDEWASIYVKNDITNGGGHK